MQKVPFDRLRANGSHLELFVLSGAPRSRRVLLSTASKASGLLPFPRPFPQRPDYLNRRRRACRRKLKWNGSVWSGQSTGTAQRLNSIWGTSATSLWAVGDSGTIANGNYGLLIRTYLDRHLPSWSQDLATRKVTGRPQAG